MPDALRTSTSGSQPLQVLWIHGVGKRTNARLMIRSLESELGCAVRLRSWIGSRSNGLPPSTTVVSPSELAEFDVVVREGGWLPGEHLAFEECVLPWVKLGGQYLLLDVARGPLIQPGEQAKPLRASYEWLRNTIGLGPRFMWEQDPIDANELRQHFTEAAQRIGETTPPEAQDQARRHLQWQLNRHSVSEGAVFYIVDRADPLGHQPISVEARTSAALDGDWAMALRRVNHLSIRYPIELEVGTSAGAAADVPFGLTYADQVPVPPYDHTWAAVSAVGDGHFALIGATLSKDDLVRSTPDNAVWVADLIGLMAERTRENVRWHARAEQRPGAHQRGLSLLRDDEGERLERKSVPLAQGSDIDVFNVAKAIAALANKSGGDVVVGQRDNLSFVPIDELLGSLGAPNPDKFLINLIGKLDAVLEPNCTSLGVKASWLPVDGAPDAAAVVHFEVPQASQPIYLRHRKAYEFFVRSGNGTKRLQGPDLDHFKRSRFT